MMTAIPTKCPPAERLHAFALGRLLDDDSEAVFEHISHCESCAAELDTIDDSEDSLVADLRSPDALVEFGDEPDCKIAVSKAIHVLTNGNAATEFPQQIGDYEIVRPLGSGGMGNVYLARHTKLGREVALKVLATHRLADPSMQSRFESEMRAVGRLSHPNIVTAHDAREIEGTAVLVTEFIDGLDLGQLVQAVGPMSIADACEIVRQVAVALAYTHDQGFVHRDIKPSNIMLSRGAEVKLLDLGLARFQYGDPDRVEITGTGQAMGTADYVAPEQVTDSRSVDARADIYALGCTLMKLLSGHAPFADEKHQTPFAKMTAHVSTAPPRLIDRRTDCPNELASLVDSMLQKEPARRPQSAMQVAEQISKFTSGHDLRQLSGQALATGLRSPEKLTASVSPLTNPTTSNTRRRVPVSVAIASGFIGMLLGIALGVIITIKYPDGTKAQIDLPPDSQVAVQYTADAVKAKPEATREAKNPMSGIWHVDSVNGVELPTVLFVFSEGRYYILDENIPVEVGAYTIQHSTGIVNAQQVEVCLAMGLGTADWKAYPSLGDPQPVNLAFDQSTIPDVLKPAGITNNVLGNMGITLRRLHDYPATDLAALKMHSDGIISSEELTGLMLCRKLDDVPVDLIRQAYPKYAAAKHAVSLSNALKQIGVAFHNFHASYNKFPGSTNILEGAYRVNNNDVQPFSWRVAILPFIERTDLYEQYRFDEPWDSEHNSKLLEKMPDVYRSPSASNDEATGHTHILGFATEHGALGLGNGQKMRDFTDGTSNTLLLIESSKSVPWTKPKDLTDTQLENLPDQPLHYLLSDGGVRTMDPIDRPLLEKLITRDGGERIDF